MSINSPPYQPFVDDSPVESHVIEQHLHRFLWVVAVRGLGEFDGVFVAGLDGVWIGGPSLHGSGGIVECCCEDGLRGKRVSWFIVGQGLVHEFL